MYNLITKDRKTWIFESDEYPTEETHPEITGFNSLSCNHESIEALKEKLGIPESPCKHCGQIFGTRYNPPYDTILAETSTCFSCHLWIERSNQYKVDGRIMIVNWEWYTVANESATIGHFRGFGGREFKFEIIDEAFVPGSLPKRIGKVITGTNVWYGGEIPEHLRHLFYNNAKILP